MNGPQKRSQRARSWGRRFLTLYRGAALLLLNTVILLCFVEMVALGVRLRRDEAGTYLDSFEARAALPYYADQDWGRTYWQEFERLENEHQRYFPYVGWRRPAFDGETITVRSDGTRITPGASCEPGAYSVHVYGGSTVWGTWSPDFATIPAYLQAGLTAQHSGPVCVENYGESAYVSTQDVILFLLNLQRGRIPDVAIFYGGANDLAAATQSGQPAVHHNFADIAERFESSPGALLDLLANTSAGRLVRDALDGTTRHPQDRELGAREDTLARSVAETYLANVELAEALGRAYGVRILFAWRPGIDIGAKPLTRGESLMRRELADQIDPELAAGAHARIAQAADERPALIDLGGIFDDVETGIWIDGLHVTPAGNERIAAALLDVLAEDP